MEEDRVIVTTDIYGVVAIVGVFVAIAFSIWVQFNGQKEQSLLPIFIYMIIALSAILLSDFLGWVRSVRDN